MSRHYSMVSKGPEPSLDANLDDCVHHVRAIRWRQGLSQHEFAARYGIPLATLRAWEQDLVQPDPVALVLLIVIDRQPDAVLRALRRDSSVASGIDGDLFNV
jgi:DNA-binding transcriptional regulator YiaG